ncbi:MAG TPA: hypothetical protein VGC87_20615 [Pyrinomonadaceae bacterium]|jgi:hypothetical protein
MEEARLWDFGVREEIRRVAIYFPAVIFGLIVAYLVIKRRFKK